MEGGSLTWRILWELGLARLKTFSEVLVKDDRVIVRKNNRDVCVMHGMVRTHSVTDAKRGDGSQEHSPTFVGTQLTSWNFFAWMTSVSGNVARRPCLERFSFPLSDT